MDGKTNRGDQATEHTVKAYKMKCMSAGGKGFSTTGAKSLFSRNTNKCTSRETVLMHAFYQNEFCPTA